MIGGTVVSCSPSPVAGRFIVEVLCEHRFDRCFRVVEQSLKAGDLIWWQSHTAYVTRHGEFVDQDIGMCFPSAHPVNAADAKRDADGMSGKALEEGDDQ